MFPLRSPRMQMIADSRNRVNNFLQRFTPWIVYRKHGLKAGGLNGLPYLFGLYGGWSTSGQPMGRALQSFANLAGGIRKSSSVYQYPPSDLRLTASGSLGWGLQPNLHRRSL